MKHSHNFIDIVGKTFGRLVVMSEADKDKKGNIMWLCGCDCGNEKIIDGSSLKRGLTKSCGCISREKVIKRNKEMCGKKQTKKFIEKRIAPLRGRKRPKHSEKMLGKNNPNYNPNLTDEERFSNRCIPGYSGWRKSVYERDNFICQKCGISKSGKLNAHHIESYDNNPELRTKVSNGITLCVDCHKDFHHQYGRGNNTREQLNKFLKDINGAKSTK